MSETSQKTENSSITDTITHKVSEEEPTWDEEQEEEEEEREDPTEEEIEPLKDSGARLRAIETDKQCDAIINDMKFNLVELRSEEANHPLTMQWRMRKNEYIRRWADALARKHEIGTWDRPLDWISTEISQDMRTLKFTEDEIRHVRESLPKKYKRESMARVSGGSTTSGGGASGIGDGGDISADLEPTLATTLRDIDRMSPDQLFEYVENATEAKRMIKDRHRTILNDVELGIEHATERSEQLGYRITMTPTDESSEVISTIKPNSHPSQSSDVAYQLQKYIENDYLPAFRSMFDKLMTYPPEDPKDDSEVAKFLSAKLFRIRQEVIMIGSFTDDKYAFSLRNWFKVVVDDANHGKHAAAVKNKVTPIGITKKDRPLTRERVGDVAEQVWQYMLDWEKSLGYDAWWFGLVELWDNKYRVPLNADRRNREAPKLSEAAFSHNDGKDIYDLRI